MPILYVELDDRREREVRAWRYLLAKERQAVARRLLIVACGFIAAGVGLVVHLAWRGLP